MMGSRCGTFTVDEVYRAREATVRCRLRQASLCDATVCRCYTLYPGGIRVSHRHRDSEHVCTVSFVLWEWPEG